MNDDDIVEQVRSRYAEAARAVLESRTAGPHCCGGAEGSPAGEVAPCCGPAASGGPISPAGEVAPCCGPAASGGPSSPAGEIAPCCGPAASGGPSFGAGLYASTDADELPQTALLASLGCGNPTAVADLREGEVVLDLGSGGGIDVLLSARRVGKAGKAYGIDMTDEMLELAERNRREAGLSNVEFLKGRIEAVPLPEAAVDVVISNCVINLSTDKPAVFREMARVLRAGGRIGISDVVAADELSPADRARRGSFAGCVAGALTFAEYESGLAEAGFRDVKVTPTHEVSPGMFSAIVKARTAEPAQAAPRR